MYERKSVSVLFWVLVAVFIMLVAGIFIPPVNRSLLPVAIFPAFGVVFVLGAALFVLTIREKAASRRKKFLLLTGASAAGLPLFAVIHNLVSGLLNIEEAVFFVLATMICPLGFLAGIVGTIVISVKNRGVGYSGTNV